MSRLWIRVLPVCLLVLICGTHASAQIPNCGSVTTDARMWQEGYRKYVFADFQTVSQITGCFLEVQAEGWVEGVGGALQSRQPHFAYLKIGRSIPYYGRWQSTGRHWVIWLAGFRWEFRGETHRQLDAVPPPSGGGQGGGPAACDDPERRDDTSRGGNGCDSPILVDVAGDGYRLTSVRRGVSFDLDADGVPEQVAWTRAGSDDAFLALDRNGNGVIDNGAELFGNSTPVDTAPGAPPAENGFEALKFAETNRAYGPGGVADGRIDGQDDVFGRLLLWTDRNHNGLSEPDELQRLSDSDLLAISTDYRASKRKDRHGNEFRLRGRGWWRDGVMRPLFDVWLLTRDLAGDTDEDEEETTAR